MSYKILLLDADNTLLDFNKAEANALEQTFITYNFDFDGEILRSYSAINQKCWEEFEQGLITKKTLLSKRFQLLFDSLGLKADVESVRITYQEELSKGAFLLEGAYKLCRDLSVNHDLYIVTNGVASTQHRRIKDSGLDKLVKDIFVSEEVGFKKPERGYFDYVFSHIKEFDKSQALLVGDSLSADIVGGINAGLNTCWYNPLGKSAPKDMAITYTIQNLEELRKIV